MSEPTDHATAADVGKALVRVDANPSSLAGGLQHMHGQYKSDDLTRTAARYLTTLPVKTHQDRMTLARTLTDIGIAAKSAVNKTFAVIGVTITDVNAVNDEGVVTSKAALKLTCEDGTIIGTDSPWFRAGILAIMDALGQPPTAVAPWRIEIHPVDCGKDGLGQPRTAIRAVLAKDQVGRGSSK